MTRDQVIERLCKLLSVVWNQAVDASEPNDCVCTKRYEAARALGDRFGTPEEYFRHGETALLLMEKFVAEGLRTHVKEDKVDND